MDFNGGMFKATSEADCTEMKLVVKPLPEISDAILDKEVNVGREAIFKCTVNDPEAPFQWFVNGSEIKEDGDKYR